MTRLTDRAVIFARVSSKSQEDEGYSLDSQVKLMRGYCENRGLIVDQIFKIAESASKNEQRRIFQRAMKYISDSDIKNLVVEKVDRHVRNLHDAVDTNDWLTVDEERKIHFVKDTLIMHKNSRSQEWLNWGIRVVMAKNYIDNLREEAMKGWAEKLAQGWLPAVPPPGYKTVTENGKRIHVPDPATKGIVKELFELYLEPSQSIATITNELYARGIRTRKGRAYVKSHVQKVLTNPFYIGTNHFDGKDYPGMQETFISKELFKRVQVKMHGKRPAKQRKHNPVFKNLINCERCGGLVTWQLQKGRYYGACQRLKPECRGAKTIREDRAETYIMEKLNELVCPSPEIIDWVSAQMRERYSEKYAAHEEAMQAIDSQLVRLKRMENELYDDKLAGEISRETYTAKHANLQAQQVELEDKRSKLSDGTGNRVEQRLALLNLSQKAAEIYQTRTIEQKRLIITKLFKSITSFNGSVSVTYTNFVRVIADKTLQTRAILEEGQNE